MTGLQPRVYLLDVEGTVAPISLVTEQLFPYARSHFPDFLRKSRGDENVRADLALLAEENRKEKAPGVPLLPEVVHPEQVETPRFRLDAMVYLTWLMDRDRKSTALKSLQGKIWKKGFESGRLKGTLFPDVAPAFARWAREGKVAIYSSGSVDAQQLLFRHTTAGDLTSLITSYFDTRTGPKFESASYAEIASKIEAPPQAMLFFSDSVRELDAARDAGCQTRLVVREGNAPVDDENGHLAVESFDQI
jgi:enolase-phosphatase E1